MPDPSHPKPLIIDCDPGFDDAVAILLALAHPEHLRVEAITTVCGNVGLEHTQRNARAIVELAGAATPVHAGCPRPMVVPAFDATHIHGADGIAGAGLPPPAAALAPDHAVDWLRRRLREAPPHSVTLCAIGPLTNLAAAIVQEPAIGAAVDRLVLMGGAIGLGNVTPAAEFNFYADPHAARIVFGAGLPIVMVPLELTHQALATPARLAAIKAVATPAARAVAGMIEAFPAEFAARRGGVPLHDPCAIAYLLWPELMAGRHAQVEIETDGLCAGRSLVHGPASAAPDAPLVLDRLDADGFFARLTDSLSRLGGPSRR